MAAQTITVSDGARFVFKTTASVAATAEDADACEPRGEAMAYLPALRAVRRQRGLSQWQVCLATVKAGCPVTMSTVAALDRCDRPARFPTIHKLARALGCTAEALARLA